MRHLHEKFRGYVYGGSRYRQEVFEQIKLLIVFTLGFTIAFSWRQTIFDATLSFIESITSLEPGIEASIIASLAITIVSLLIIFVTAKLLPSEKH